MVLVTIEIPQLHCDKVFVVPVLLVVRVPELQVVIKTVFIPQLQIVVKIDAIHESLGLGMLRHAGCGADTRGDPTGAVLGMLRHALCRAESRGDPTGAVLASSRTRLLTLPLLCRQGPGRDSAENWRSPAVVAVSWTRLLTCPFSARPGSRRAETAILLRCLWRLEGFMAVVTPYFALRWAPNFQPSNTHSCECSRAPG